MSNITRETIDLMKTQLGLGRDNALKKGVSISTGLVEYDLMAPAKNLYPVITPLRNSIPRVGRKNPGDAAHWKQVSAITGSGYNAMGWVPEGQRSGTMSYTTANKSQTYVTLGEEDYLTFEAEAASQGFEEENSMVSFRLLQKTMLKEEMAILGGNAGGIQLGTPATPATASSGTGATLPTATYYVGVVALTLEGFNNSSLAGGVASTKVITGADGKTFTLNGGSSALSAESSGQAVTLGAPLTATVTAIQGAVAYAWYVATTSGAKTLQAITTINSVSITAALTAGRQNQSAITADNSWNANYAFDGLLTTALNSANSAYVNLLATGTAGAGSTLTASGSGTVVEIDTMLQSMWDTNRISPTVMYVNSQQLKDIKTKCLSASSAPLIRINQDIDQKGYELTAGGRVSWYFNPFRPDGGEVIPVKVHPNVPNGTILAYAEKLPEWYQSNNVPNVAEVLTRRDYYRMDWPLRTRQHEYGVYAEECLAVYAPFACGVICNIGNG